MRIPELIGLRPSDNMWQYLEGLGASGSITTDINLDADQYHELVRELVVDHRLGGDCHYVPGHAAVVVPGPYCMATIWYAPAIAVLIERETKDSK
jgi:hypothetical protein